jgi:hypothetical protein
MCLSAIGRIVRNTTSIRALSLSVLVGFPAIANSQETAAIVTSTPLVPLKELSTQDIDVNEDLIIGGSYDSLMREFTNNKCVQRKTTDTHLGQPSSMHTDTSVHEQTTASQYSDSTAVSISAAYHGGETSGDAAAKYLFNGKSNSYNSTLIVTTSVQYDPQQYFISDFKLTDEAINYLKTGAYSVNDSYYLDNFTDPVNKMRARLGLSLDDFVAGK